MDAGLLLVCALTFGIHLRTFTGTRSEAISPNSEIAA